MTSKSINALKHFHRWPQQTEKPADRDIQGAGREVIPAFRTLMYLFDLAAGNRLCRLH
jgi:hypothetical protein